MYDELHFTKPVTYDDAMLSIITLPGANLEGLELSTSTELPLWLILRQYIGLFISRFDDLKRSIVLKHMRARKDVRS